MTGKGSDLHPQRLIGKWVFKFPGLTPTAPHEMFKIGPVSKCVSWIGFPPSLSHAHICMNPDRLEGQQTCASSSNRNFKGRQGSPTGRTLLMSPAMVAAAAIAGEVIDVRTVLDAVPA